MYDITRKKGVLRRKCHLKRFWRIRNFGNISASPVVLEDIKISFLARKKKVVRISGKTTATLACSKTANIIIITLKTLDDMEAEKNKF